MQADSIPEDAQALIINGPTSDLDVYKRQGESYDIHKEKNGSGIICRMQ